MSDRCKWCGEDGGDHAPDCLVRRAMPPVEPIPGGVVGPEDIIGPSGQPLWVVTAATGRAVGGVVVTDTFHVRAASYDGAMLLAREVRLFMTDHEALQITDERDNL